MRHRRMTTEQLVQMAKAAEILVSLGSKLSEAIRTLAAQDPVPSSVTITEEEQQVATTNIPVRTLESLNSGDTGDEGYIPLRRPNMDRVSRGTALETTIQEVVEIVRAIIVATPTTDVAAGEALDQEASAPRTFTEQEAVIQEDSAIPIIADEASALEGNASTTTPKEEVLGQEASTSIPSPTEGETWSSKSRVYTTAQETWAQLQAVFEAAEADLFQARAKAEGALAKIRRARESDPDVAKATIASGIRRRFITLQSVTSTIKSVWDTKLAQQEAREAEVRAIEQRKTEAAEAERELELAGQAATKQQQELRKKRAEAVRARVEVLFAEDEARKKANRQELWRTHPEKFCCQLCGHPAVRCPNG